MSFCSCNKRENIRIKKNLVVIEGLDTTEPEQNSLITFFKYLSPKSEIQRV